MWGIHATPRTKTVLIQRACFEVNSRPACRTLAVLGFPFPTREVSKRVASPHKLWEIHATHRTTSVQIQKASFEVGLATTRRAINLYRERQPEGPLTIIMSGIRNQ